MTIPRTRYQEFRATSYRKFIFIYCNIFWALGKFKPVCWIWCEPPRSFSEDWVKSITPPFSAQRTNRSKNRPVVRFGMYTPIGVTFRVTTDGTDSALWNDSSTDLRGVSFNSMHESYFRLCRGQSCHLCPRCNSRRMGYGQCRPMPKP